MKEVKSKKLNGKVMWAIKMNGEVVIRFVKKRKNLSFVVVSEWKRKDGIRILEERFGDPDGTGSYSDPHSPAELSTAYSTAA